MISLELLKKIRSIGGTVLFVCSAFLTEFLFWNFSNVWYEKLVWLVVGGIVEICKYFALMYAKYLISQKAPWYQIAGYFIGYFCACAISLIGSLAFALHSFQGQDANAVAASAVVNTTSVSLSSITNQIAAVTAEKNALPKDYLKRQRELDDTLRNLNAQLTALTTSVTTAEAKPVEVSNYTVFAELGDKINLSGKDVLFRIILFMVVFIEIFMAVLTDAPTEKKTDVKEVKEFKEILNVYLDALFDIAEGKVRLNNDEKIATLTDLTSAEIKKCRQFILSSSYKGVPLIQGGRGAVKASFTKESTLKICNFILDTVA